MTRECTQGGKGKGGKAKGGGKKGKKGMQLLPEQEAALLRITGCLRHLSMLDTDKCRIARCDVAKMCDDLAMGAAKGPLRWNCRSLLGNVATMIENRSILEVRGDMRSPFCSAFVRNARRKGQCRPCSQNAGVMEEYLGLCSLSLTKEARSDLRTFFW